MPVSKEAAKRMEARRKAAIALVEKGVPQVEVARRLKVSDRAVKMWVQNFRENGIKGIHSMASLSQKRPVDESPPLPEIIGAKLHEWISSLLKQGGMATIMRDTDIEAGVDNFRVVVPGGGVDVSRKTLLEAVRAAAGREPAKRCPACEQTKPANLFARNRSRADGINPRCMACERARLRSRSMKEAGRSESTASV